MGRPSSPSPSVAVITCCVQATVSGYGVVTSRGRPDRDLDAADAAAVTPSESVASHRARRLSVMTNHAIDIAHATVVTAVEKIRCALHGTALRVLFCRRVRSLYTIAFGLRSDVIPILIGANLVIWLPAFHYFGFIDNLNSLEVSGQPCAAGPKQLSCV